MQRFRFGVVFMAVALVVAPMAGVAQPTDGTQQPQQAGQSSQFGLQGVGQQQTGQQQSQQANQSQQDNATFEPVLVENETVSVAGTPFHIEEGLLTLRNGTLALFVKRGAVTADGSSAAVTNTRVALGDNVTPSEANRTRQALEDGRLTAPGVSNARLAAGLLSVETNGIAFSESNISTNVGSPTVPPGRAIAGPEERPFEVTNLSAPENVPVGESFNVSATIRNPGNRTGTEELQYRFDGVTAQRQTVTLGAGESQTVTFEVSSGTLPSEPGTFTHGVYAFDSNQSASISLTGGNQSNQSG